MWVGLAHGPARGGGIIDCGGGPGGGGIIDGSGGYDPPPGVNIQIQGCQQVADEAEREYKKMSERINEGREAMKGSYSTFMAELQASGVRLCKQTIPELSQSVEKAIDTLRSRYGIH
ncbi:hypothetical protein CQW23_11279 [Capsicum baccatum]|uniref:Uncharacterized protein n=1 Tax=Capsicum baccatum TaxID=33114 RepID=A0A2G2WPD4_CAPBA|nr:hypothetical protein CQW23_11279 [Capsicum baccatum]